MSPAHQARCWPFAIASGSSPVPALSGERIGMAPGSLRQIPPVWCTWYQYYSDVTEADVAANLAAMDDLGVPVGVLLG